MAGITGTGFLLKPLRYQFDEFDNEWDGNWLQVKITVVDGPKRWSATAPAFLTWELERLINWLRALADAQPDTRDDFGTIEPNLRFEARGRGDDTRLGVVFSHEYHPEWRTWQQERREAGRPYDLSDVVLELKPGIVGLRLFADQLEQELAPYPKRVLS
jgi:hypothetical protein